MPLLVLALTGSAAEAGLVGVARMVAFPLVALPAGVIADRSDRRKVMIVCAAGRAVATASVAVALLAGRPGLGQLMAVALIDAGLCSVATVAERGLIGEVAPDALYSDAVAVNEGRAAAAFTAGPPLGGALFGFSRRFRSWPTGCRSSRRSPRSSSCDGRFRVRVRGQWHRGAPRSVTAWLGRSLMRGRA